MVNPSVISRLPVRSRQQALDWSLVLASQDIECAIDYSADETGRWSWRLLGAESDRERSLNAIRLYREENRRWPWRREITGVLFDWGALAWVALVAVFFWLSDARPDLKSAGIMDSSAATHGEWWRLFTAVWLHGDLGHLGANATLGLVLLGLVMGRFGTGLGLLAAYLAGAGGNLLAWILSTTVHRSLGASGLVMGALGLLAAQSVYLPRLRLFSNSPTSHGQPKPPYAVKRFLASLFAGIMLFVLLGLAPDTDVLAHFGGFLSGLLLGLTLAPLRHPSQMAATNFFASVVFALLVIVPWWLALNPAR